MDLFPVRWRGHGVNGKGLKGPQVYVEEKKAQVSLKSSDRGSTGRVAGVGFVINSSFGAKIQ